MDEIDLNMPANFRFHSALLNFTTGLVCSICRLFLEIQVPVYLGTSLWSPFERHCSYFQAENLVRMRVSTWRRSIFIEEHSDQHSRIGPFRKASNQRWSTDFEGQLGVPIAKCGLHVRWRQVCQFGDRTPSSELSPIRKSTQATWKHLMLQSKKLDYPTCTIELKLQNGCKLNFAWTPPNWRLTTFETFERSHVQWNAEKA